MVRSFFRLAVAASIALLINGGLAVGMAFWANLGAPPSRSKPVRKSVDIPFLTTPPPTKQAEVPRRRLATTQVARANLPALNLPSAIAVPVFDPQSMPSPGVVHPRETTNISGLSEETILTEDMVDEPPRPVARTSLRYPKSAEVAGVEGKVETRLLLSADGTVLQIRILSATPPGVFESAAKESLAGWRFSAATFRGQKLKAWVRQRVVFKLH